MKTNTKITLLFLSLLGFFVLFAFGYFYIRAEEQRLYVASKQTSDALVIQTVLTFKMESFLKPVKDNSAWDEMVVLSHRLANSRARQANYEALLTLLNDCFQGSVKGLGFIFAGTDECLEDRRRGLFSYEALRSRLAENDLAKQQGFVDLSGPVLRLQPLAPEDLFVLLKNIVFVHASGDVSKTLPDEAITAVLRKANDTLGAEFFRTPRET